MLLATPLALQQCGDRIRFFTQRCDGGTVVVVELQTARGAFRLAVGQGRTGGRRERLGEWQVFHMCAERLVRQRPTADVRDGGQQVKRLHMVHHRHKGELVAPAFAVQVERCQVGAQQLHRRELQHRQPEELNVVLLA